MIVSYIIVSILILILLYAFVGFFSFPFYLLGVFKSVITFPIYFLSFIYPVGVFPTIVLSGTLFYIVASYILTLISHSKK